jgi:RNA polymerase sigma factor (TIGR02999 family)
LEPNVPSEDNPPITQLLHEVSVGNSAAAGALLEQVYDQLRSIAGERMAHERGSHTLQATALVHEAYLRLMAGDERSKVQSAWKDRGHFYRAAAEAMRRILVDHARHRGAQKRGGSRA